MRISRLFRIASASLALAAGLVMVASSASLAGPMFKIGASDSSDYNEAQILSSPEPEIPSELHEQCFKSCCIARFLIKADGKSTVKLLSSSGSTDVDDIALSTLQRWRFKPAMLNGKPVESTRKIRVEFEVE